MSRNGWKLAPLLFIIPLVLSVTFVSAPPTGGIRVNPSLPIMLNSPAGFTVETQQPGATADEPHIFLVMTEGSYDGLSDSVVVTWSGGGLSIAKGSFTIANDNGDKLPPGTTEGAGYTVASLKDHLGTSGPIYWAFMGFLGGNQLTNEPQAFTIDFSSTNPKMLVYVLGKSSGSTEFDMRTPPTIPGFMVPEPATIFGIAASMGALTGYAVKKRKII